ncbi:MAG: hypothetical protein ABIU20_00895 [Blastocatellia bacterium]
MPSTPAIPIAVTLPPSEFPYSFVEVVAFQGIFDPSLGFAGPKGIAYHSQLDRLVVSLSPSGFDPGRNQILNLVARDGSRTSFAPGFQAFRGIESKIVIVPESGPPVDAGFTPGDIFLGRGPQTEISHLSASGEIIADIFAQFGAGGGFWGGLAFDTEGDFGGRLIAAEANGKIYLLSPDGSSEVLIDLQRRLEGLAVAPPTFGPHAKNVIAGVEGYNDDDPHGGEIFAISPDRTSVLLANIGYAAEDIQFIPQNSGTLYQTQICFDRERENRLLSVSSSQFLNRFGRMIINNELTGELWEVDWDGVRYTQQPVGRVPGRWSTTGFNVQGTELEAAAFAVRMPRIPNWTEWKTVPGNFATDRAPAAATDSAGDVILFGKGSSDQEIYLNRRQPLQLLQAPETGPAGPAEAALLPDPSVDPPDQGWQGWEPDPASVTTPHALACSLHNNRMHAFAVKPDGGIVYKIVTDGGNLQPTQSWQEVPGEILTNTNVACATVNGRLVLCALGEGRRIYLNELAPGGRYWSGWYPLPGGGSTDVTPTIASFQDELYVFIKGLTSKRILVKTRTLNGDWTPWAEVPGAGRTESAITAAATDGQLFIFVKGLDRLTYANVASETGTWSGWLQLPNAIATDTVIAPAVAGNRVYLFAKGVDTPQVFVRSTL